MRIGDKGFSHPGYMRQTAQQQTPSSLRVGALVACQPLGPEPATSEIRQRFLGFLASPPIMELILSASHVDKDARWTPWGGHGRMNLEAALTCQDDEGAPVASALLLLPEAGQPSFGRDPRFAELVLHIQPRNAGPGPAKPVNLPKWHERFTRALNLPSAFAGFLAQGIQLTTVAEPPAQLGIWLKAAQIQELIDLEELAPIAGTHPVPWFMGWAVADESGSPPNETAVTLLRQMCDYTLQLDKYEHVLGSLLIQ